MFLCMFLNSWLDCVLRDTTRFHESIPQYSKARIGLFEPVVFDISHSLQFSDMVDFMGFMGGTWPIITYVL